MTDSFQRIIVNTESGFDSRNAAMAGLVLFQSSKPAPIPRDVIQSLQKIITATPSYSTDTDNDFRVNAARLLQLIEKTQPNTITSEVVLSLREAAFYSTFEKTNSSGRRNQLSSAYILTLLVPTSPQTLTTEIVQEFVKDSKSRTDTCEYADTAAWEQRILYTIAESSPESITTQETQLNQPASLYPCLHIRGAVAIARYNKNYKSKTAEELLNAITNAQDIIDETGRLAIAYGLFRNAIKDENQAQFIHDQLIKMRRSFHPYVRIVASQTLEMIIFGAYGRKLSEAYPHPPINLADVFSASTLDERSILIAYTIAQMLGNRN